VARLNPTTIVGVPASLERAIGNLLDNAAKWSPPAATVEVGLTPTDRGTVAVSVADSGPGIAEADLPYIFERFYRSSAARTLPGSGLGLAIVAQVAARHGGSVRASRRPEGGTLMFLELPGQPSSEHIPHSQHV
jgi:two-component system sensor histidine kinase MprB